MGHTTIRFGVPSTTVTGVFPSHAGIFLLAEATPMREAVDAITISCFTRSHTGLPIPTCITMALLVITITPMAERLTTNSSPLSVFSSSKEGIWTHDVQSGNTVRSNLANNRTHQSCHRFHVPELQEGQFSHSCVWSEITYEGDQGFGIASQWCH